MNTATKAQKFFANQVKPTSVQENQSFINFATASLPSIGKITTSVLSRLLKSEVFLPSIVKFGLQKSAELLVEYLKNKYYPSRNEDNSDYKFIEKITKEDLHSLIKQAIKDERMERVEERQLGFLERYKMPNLGVEETQKYDKDYESTLKLAA